MEWRDTGFVLSARRHGESALIVELLTARARPPCRAGARRAIAAPARIAAAGQPRRRELARPARPSISARSIASSSRAHAARLLDDPDRLAALAAAAALLLAALPEREPHADLYAVLRRVARGARFGTALGRNPMSPGNATCWRRSASGSISRAARRPGTNERPRLCLAALGPRGVARGRRSLPRQAVAAARLFVARAHPPAARTSSPGSR